MKQIAIIVLLLWSGDAFGECAHRPYELIWAEKYRDGGSISVTVADSAGCVVGLSLDWRLHSPTHGRIRFRAMPPEFTRSGLVSEKEEGRVLRLLSNVADKYMSREEQFEALEGNWPERISGENRRYNGWLLELLRTKGWR